MDERPAEIAVAIKHQAVLVVLDGHIGDGEVMAAMHADADPALARLLQPFAIQDDLLSLSGFAANRDAVAVREQDIVKVINAVSHEDGHAVGACLDCLLQVLRRVNRGNRASGRGQSLRLRRGPAHGLCVHVLPACQRQPAFNPPFARRVDRCVPCHQRLCFRWCGHASCGRRSTGSNCLGIRHGDGRSNDGTCQGTYHPGLPAMHSAPLGTAKSHLTPAGTPHINLPRSDTGRRTDAPGQGIR